jgi:hypothetical protein
MLGSRRCFICVSMAAGDMLCVTSNGHGVVVHREHMDRIFSVAQLVTKGLPHDEGVCHEGGAA